MVLEEFREELRKVYALSEMDADASWPFVFNQYEKGDIFVDNGIFYFADQNHNWVESPLRLSGIANLRYGKGYAKKGIDIIGKKPSESDIWVHFLSGEHIWINNQNEIDRLQIFAVIQKSQLVQELKQRCERRGSLSFIVLERGE